MRGGRYREGSAAAECRTPNGGGAMQRESDGASTAGSFGHVLFEHALGEGERRVGGGDAAVDRGLQKDLLELVVGETGPAGCTQVHRELLVAAEGDEGRDRNGAAGTAVEAGAGPDLPPGIPRDQVLEVRGEGRRPRHGAVDVLVAEHGAANLHPLVV